MVHGKIHVFPEMKTCSPITKTIVRNKNGSRQKMVINKLKSVHV